MLGGQMHDRARVISKKKGNVRVEGGYQKVPQEGPWFRCIYDPGTEGEVPSFAGRRRRRAGVHIVTRRLALDGTEIEIKATDTVEVDSVRFGTLRLDVVGTPERLTHGRTWIGWTVDLGKTDRATA